MGAASLHKPIELNPDGLVASLKKFVDATKDQPGRRSLQREDIDAFVGGLSVIMEREKVVRELTPEAEEEAVVANPQVMVDAARRATWRSSASSSRPGWRWTRRSGTAKRPRCTRRLRATRPRCPSSW